MTNFAATDASREFVQCYKEFRPRLYRIALGMTRSPDTAEEIVSEAFARAWSGYEKFRKEASFGTWIHRILVNLVYDAGRSREEVELKEHVGSAVWEPGAFVEAREIRVRLDEALAKLSPLQRQVFWLKEYEGLRHAAIARRMGIAEGTSKVHYFHALRRLREELHDLL